MGSIQYEGRLKIISDNYSFVVLTVLRTSFIAKNVVQEKISYSVAVFPQDVA